MWNGALYPMPMPINIDSIGAGTNLTIGGALAQFTGQLYAVQVTNGATVAANGANYVTIAVQKGGVVMASLDTSASPLTLNVARAMVLSATPANKKFTVGTQLDVVVTQTGGGAPITGPCQVTLWLTAGYTDS